MKSNYAAPDLSTAEAALSDHAYIHGLPFVKEMLNASPNAMVLMNAQRQILYANETLCRLFRISQPNAYVGQRPGELLYCIHADKGPVGCGSSEACGNCGGLSAVLKCRETGSRASREMKLTATIAGQMHAFDYQVTASPFAAGPKEITIVTFVDSSHEKRKRVLQRIFFHDILNTAGNLVGLSDIVSAGLPDVEVENVALINSCAKQLVEEIRSQRTLMKAENNELTVRCETVDTLSCLKKTARIYREFSSTRNIAVRIDDHAEPLSLQSDKTLLLRVLNNMTKNALEASSEDDTITIGCHRWHHRIRFWVHNPAYIPRNIQLQIFQRSFSTKGDGRGLGTYSIKLLVENYLTGSVAFESSRSGGTRFYITLPVALMPGAPMD